MKTGQFLFSACRRTERISTLPINYYSYNSNVSFKRFLSTRVMSRSHSLPADQWLLVKETIQVMEKVLTLNNGILYDHLQAEGLEGGYKYNIDQSSC